jgi:hypothetical protein
VPTFALVTPGGSALGPFELDDEEAQQGAIIRRPSEPEGRGGDEPNLRVVGFVERTVPENFDVLVVEEA